MCYLIVSIILLTIVLLICTIIYNINKSKIGFQENWESYQQTPLNYIQTGSSPLAFYTRNRYRKPYRYPLKHDDSSPYPNMSYWH